MALIDASDFANMAAPIVADVTAAKIYSGKVLPPEQHLLLFDADDWETFIREWAQFQRKKYELVVQLGGASDYGVDVACFKTNEGFEGAWDNFQCKYYTGAALAPHTALPEIGKILWHAFENRITLPENYYFFAPKDCGPLLKKLLLNPSKLKDRLKEKWSDWCATSITSVKTVELEGEFLAFVDSEDYSRYKYKPTHDVIEEHRETPFYLPRFGGGLPDRPATEQPPAEIGVSESRYIEQILEAYSDKVGCVVCSQSLSDFGKLETHFHRQRESFFHAEALRSFARDTVPEGTFEALQEEIFEGVIDASEEDHENGLDRLHSVSMRATQLNLTANGLIQVTKVHDRRGICHQLANDDRLIWVPKDD